MAAETKHQEHPFLRIKICTTIRQTEKRKAPEDNTKRGAFKISNKILEKKINKRQRSEVIE